MGNYKFRLSDMMPNAWFYKLRDMSKTRNHTNSMKKKLPSPTTTSQKPLFSHPRTSYYRHIPETHKPYKFQNPPKNPKFSDTQFHNSAKNPKFLDTQFPDPPRKSSMTKTKRKSIYQPSPRLVASSVWTKPEPIQPQDYFFSSSESSPEFESRSWSSSCDCRVTSSHTDIIIDMNEKSCFKKVEKIEVFDTISDLQLPPILTKPIGSSKLGKEIETKFSPPTKIVKEIPITTPKPKKETKTGHRVRKLASSGMKLRANSPRIASKRVQACGRRSVSSGKMRKSFSRSLAVVKSSVDPQRDFRESMVEMIVENNIRASKDLEELLACYLSLNSDEYHETIVKAFEQTWFDIAGLPM